MQLNILNNKPANKCIEIVRRLIGEASFKDRHRKNAKQFTRECTLSFPVLVLFLLRKSVKSMQKRLHEFLLELTGSATLLMVGGGAVTKARAKLEASAYVELNEEGPLKCFYEPENEEQVQRWYGHRLLGIDGSKTRLPKSQELGKAFGWVQTSNQHGIKDEYPEGRMSVLYDVLNEMGLEGKLVSSTIGETELALEHLAKVSPGDVLLTDRGYSGFRWFVEVLQREAHFVCRCSESSFSLVDELFARDQAGVSVIVDLVAQKNLRPELRRDKLPTTTKVRFVSVRLSTGELEVLATSLLDESKYPTEDFSELYWKRWGHETYYGRVKGALDLENFSGKTEDAIAQDFQALVFLANLETMLIGPVEQQLAERSTRLKNPVQVNRSDSLHGVKCRTLDLLASDLPVEEVIKELTVWFMSNPVTVRKKRKVPRRKFSANRSYHFQKRVRKITY